MSATSACLGCGVPLPEQRSGRRRKWCSERCRKDQYGGTCEVCGGVTDGSTPGRAPAAKVCASCLRWTDEALIDAIRRWAEEHGGIPPTVQQWRRAHPSYPSAHTVIERIGWNEALLRAGFALRCDRRPETQEWIEEQLRAGTPTRDIADALGVTLEAIGQRMYVRGKSISGARSRA